MKTLGKPKPKKKDKKPRSPVKQVSSRGTLVKKAHALIREIVMLRDNGCVCPPPAKGHSSIRQAGHIIRSTKGGSRFSLWNVHEQCSSCNGRHVRDWQIYQDWFEKAFDSERWNMVKDESKKVAVKTHELPELINQLSAIHERQKQPESLLWFPYFTQEEILNGSWRTK